MQASGSPPKLLGGPTVGRGQQTFIPLASLWKQPFFRGVGRDELYCRPPMGIAEQEGHAMVLLPSGHLLGSACDDSPMSTV